MPQGLKQQVGPFPLYAWLIGGLVFLGAFVFLLRRKGQAGAQAAAPKGTGVAVPLPFSTSGTSPQTLQTSNMFPWQFGVPPRDRGWEWELTPLGEANFAQVFGRPWYQQGPEPSGAPVPPNIGQYSWEWRLTGGPPPTPLDPTTLQNIALAGGGPVGTAVELPPQGVVGSVPPSAQIAPWFQQTVNPPAGPLPGVQAA